MILYAVMTFSLGALLFRLFQEPHFEQRIPFYFLFFFYLILYSAWRVLPQTHPEIRLLIQFAFFAGGVWFAGELIWIRIRNYRESTRHFRDLKKQIGPYHEVLLASKLLSQSKMGALIVLHRRESLTVWAGKGVRIDALVSKEILFSLFTPPGALHDGAVILSEGRILSAGVIVPLTKNAQISKELGTRHRAALGMSEATDAICLIISEETGAISIADKGNLHYDIDPAKLPEMLSRALRFKLDKPKAKDSPLFLTRA